MRQISVNIDVFAQIWSLRRASERDENEILKRILEEYSSKWETSAEITMDAEIREKERPSETKAREVEVGKIRWVDDVRAALVELGGRGSLHSIYQVVEQRRRTGGRSVPRTLEATIRRTLEDHSADSANFRGVNLFSILGRGEWGLR
jgi:hypothetical protein